MIVRRPDSGTTSTDRDRHRRRRTIPRCPAPDAPLAGACMSIERLPHRPPRPSLTDSRRIPRHVLDESPTGSRPTAVPDRRPVDSAPAAAGPTATAAARSRPASGKSACGRAVRCRPAGAAGDSEDGQQSHGVGMAIRAGRRRRRLAHRPLHVESRSAIPAEEFIGRHTPQPSQARSRMPFSPAARAPGRRSGRLRRAVARPTDRRKGSPDSRTEAAHGGPHRTLGGGPRGCPPGRPALEPAPDR